MAVDGNYPQQPMTSGAAFRNMGKLHSMTWSDYFLEHRRLVMDSSTMAADGISWRRLRNAERDGALIRVRRGHYAVGGTRDSVVQAVRVGGRLACVSAVLDCGIFGFDDGALHVNVGPSSSRLRAYRESPHEVFSNDGNRLRLHWDESQRSPQVSEYRVELTDAIRQVFHCQNYRLAMATLENALHLKRLSVGDVSQIFSGLPKSKQYLQKLVDSRADSGQETVLRLIVAEAGFAFDFQANVPGVGRVDLMVEGCIVVEADSRQFHDGWEAQVRDRARDVRLAALGFMSLRVVYSDIMFHPEKITAGIWGLLRTRNGFRTRTD
jgi:very-short-patch-repair endonuclease